MNTQLAIIIMLVAALIIVAGIAIHEAIKAGDNSEKCKQAADKSQATNPKRKHNRGDVDGVLFFKRLEFASHARNQTVKEFSEIAFRHRKKPVAAYEAYQHKMFAPCPENLNIIADALGLKTAYFTDKSLTHEQAYNKYIIKTQATKEIDVKPEESPNPERPKIYRW